MRLSRQDISDIIVTATEGGSNYWGSFKRHADPELDADGFPVFHSLTVKDCEGDGRTYRVTGPMLQKAATRLLNEPEHVNTSIRSSIMEGAGMDADAADCVLQFACFGEVIYG